MPGRGELSRNRRRLLTQSGVGSGVWGWPVVDRRGRGRRNGLITNRNRCRQKRKTGFLGSTRLGKRFRTPAGSLGKGCIGSARRIH
jgi:hypothetical protein